MEKIRLYIDEDLSDRIAVALRSKGFDAISAHEVNIGYKTINKNSIWPQNRHSFLSFVSLFYRASVWYFRQEFWAVMCWLIFFLRSCSPINMVFRYFFMLPIVFATLHFSYGLGSIWGVLTLRKWIVKNTLATKTRRHKKF